MKKNILIICLGIVGLSLMAFSYVKWNNKTIAETPSANSDLLSDMLLDKQYGIEDNFVYNIDSRFIENITKEDLHSATSIKEIYPEEATRPEDVYSQVEVSIINNLGDVLVSEFGHGEALNDAQRKLLKTVDYANNIKIKADYGGLTAMVTNNHVNHIIYYISVLPEHEATYKNGHDTLMEYLRERSAEDIADIDQNVLRPGRLSFTVSKNGNVENVVLESTSGIDKLDTAMSKYVAAIPGEWNPATNGIGENIDQEFVFFFGKQGC